MATTYFSTNTELGLVNALTQSLTVFLPQNSPNGKNIFIKDAAGNANKSTITIQTQGSDTFEIYATTKQVINQPFGSYQFTYNSAPAKWYITGGTFFNTMNISSVTTNILSNTTNISSSYISLSSLSLINQFASTNTFNTISSLLYYNNNLVGGGFREAIPQNVNKFSFSPYLISNLALWLDAADTSSVVTSGVNLTQWKDKSGNARNLTTKSGTITYGAYQGLNCIQNTNNSYIYSLNPVDLTQFTFFIVCLSITNVTNQSVFCAIPQSNIYNSYNSFDSFGFYVDANTPQSRFYGSLLGNNVIDAATSSNGNSYPLRMMAYTETSNTILNSFVNGNTGSTNSGTSTRSNTCAGFGLGANFNGTSPSGATSVSYTHEILVYNSVLSTFQRQYVEGYLAWKWGLQGNLPAGHPYKNAPP